MNVEFDAAKDAPNTAKHGVSLAFGARLFDDPEHLPIATVRVEDGEERRKAIGRVDGVLWTAVHALRGSVVRFISVRRSNDGEAKIYGRS